MRNFGPGNERGCQAEPHEGSPRLDSVVRGGRAAGGADKECAVLGTRDRRVNPEDDGPQSMETLNR